jgi:uncharacterized membrane protein YdjX (TVP38/TMEM64 family)
VLVYDAGRSVVTRPHVRLVLGVIWASVVTAALYVFAFHRDVVQQQLHHAASFSMLAAGAAYLALGSVRGFSLVPATWLVVLGVAFFPPVPLFILTLAGIVISSATVYLFAGALHLDDVFRRTHPQRLEQLTNVLQRHELPIIIGWSFFPLAPTDLICYVCGVLRVSLPKCLIGVAIGEGAICAIYIVAGDSLLRLLALK